MHPRDPGPDQGNEMALDRMLPCHVARIMSLGGNPAFRDRLRNIGFREGEWVEMVKQAPLTDPIEYRIGSVHVSLRREEARRILVIDVQGAFEQFPGRGLGPRHHRRGWGLRGGGLGGRRGFGRGRGPGRGKGPGRGGKGA